MSWAASSAYSPTVTRKPTTGAMATAASASSLTVGSAAASEEAAGPVRTTDQASGDLVVPLVIWNEPPQVEITCLHVLYLPMSQPSQNSSDLMNRWPSLASFVQQWSSQQNLSPSGSMASFRSLNSAHSMINLKRVLSRQRNKRASLTPEERMALIKENGGENGASNSRPNDFMDDEDFQYVDDGDMDGDDELYQLCVFAGTVDGSIVYWLFEQDVVVQVSLLVHPTAGATAAGSKAERGANEPSDVPHASPVVSIVSGIDEWGQSDMISVSKDGSVARWELPNGACSRAAISLARQLAPVKGMETFCNNRYAIVYGEHSRMMVLDTWKLELLYCVDTAQEQVRRGIAVVELKMSNSNARKTVSTSLAGVTESPSRRVSDVANLSDSSATNSRLNGASGYNHAQDLIVNTPSASASGSTGNGSSLNRISRSVSSHIWDSLVLSLGSEGLVKCFLWAKPRGGSNSATSINSASGSYQWVQESCWVISWADDTDDITCSQSTSLKDGDNMNPQTALMRSIKSSYFPRSVHVSSDASLLLFIWDTKWAILKRKWICDLSPPGPMGEVTRHSSRSASWKGSISSTTKPKPSKYVGSCRIHPRKFLAQTATETIRSSEGFSDKSSVWWEDGSFLNGDEIVLWTNTGHVYKFPVSGSTLSQAGKLFMFTKAQDQLVPRSFNKSLNAVQRGEFVAYLPQCNCCRDECSDAKVTRVDNCARRLGVIDDIHRIQGFTSCAFGSDTAAANRSLLSPQSPSIRLVHMCRKGSVGSWSLSPQKASTGPASSPARSDGCVVVPSESVYDRVKLHSLADGFVRDQAHGSAVSTQKEGRRTTVTHLILGREDTRSSTSANTSRLNVNSRKRTRSQMFPRNSSRSNEFGGSGVGSYSGTTAMLASALAPVSAFLPTAMRGRRRGSIGGGVIAGDDVYADFLLDVPVIVRGYTDGSLECKLLSSSSSSLNNCFDVSISLCHQAEVHAVAHCCWPKGSTSQDKGVGANGPPAISRSATTGSADHNSGTYMSSRKAMVTKRGAPIEDSCLISDSNPFYRARFPPPVQRRSISSRHLNIHQNATVHPANGPSTQPTGPTGARPSVTTTEDGSTPSLNFVIFSGCANGVLCISELMLTSAENSTFELDSRVLQRFKKHRGAIKEVLVSPWTRENSVCPERYVATVGEDNTVNVYAPVYLHNPYSYGASASTVHQGSRIGVEWECTAELCEHPDTIRTVTWLTECGQILVECDDDMVYVWNLDTGILERSVPVALIYDGGNTPADRGNDELDAETASSVECSKLVIGDSSLHLIKFNVNKSAEVIKTNWKAYYYGILNAKSGSLDETGESRKLKSTVTSPYAVGSIELLLLAFLLSWGASPDIDRACRQLLGLDSPRSLYSCVLLDDSSGALSIPLPWKSVFSPMPSTGGEQNPFPRKWQHSSALSATIALGIVSLCMNLMEHKYTKTEDSNGSEPAMPSSPKNKEEFHVLWSQLITQHSVVLPDYVPFFREPSLELLAKYGFHPCDYTQLAARALMNSAIKRLHPPTRSALCAEYSAKLHCEIVRLETETGGKLNGTSSTNAVDASHIVSRLGSLVILLSMIGTCYPGEISPAGAREVCDILVCLLRASVQHVASVAAELLTKGLMLFRPHLVDLSSLITQLLFIDMREKQRNPSGDSPSFGSNARVFASGGSNAALSLLVELGACETAFVLNLLQHEMNNAERPQGFRECILLYLTELINTHYLLMFRHLPSVIDTVMHCLDPTKPERRKRCLELSTRCLHNLVRRFPMIDFHKETQRLAIGTMEAVILIYDLRTATKWRVLDGHSSAVSAVAFRGDGQILVSYAAREGSVRWWNSGNTGLFGGMLKLQQSCIKEHKLEVLKGVANAPSSSGGASADLKQVIQTCRFQFLIVKEGPNNQQSSGGANGERKVLRLTREDASQVQFLM